MDEHEFWGLVKAIAPVVLVGVAIGLLPNPYRSFLLLGLPATLGLLMYRAEKKVSTGVAWFVGAFIALTFPAGCLREAMNSSGYSGDEPSCVAPRVCD